MDKYSLQLLPQSPDTQLPNHLKFSKAIGLLIFFVKHIIDALDAFYVKKYFHEFDPHVGETSCQIRAYYILLFSSNIDSKSKLDIVNKINTFKLLLKRLESDFFYYHELDVSRNGYGKSYITLKQFLIDKQYNIELTENELFLVQARILTIYKNQGFTETFKIDYQTLSDALNVSKFTARRLVHLYQINLSKVSCSFILNLLDQLPNPPISRYVLELLAQEDDDKRYILPCFWVMKIILAHMLYVKKTILITAKNWLDDKSQKKLYLSFEVNEQKQQYQLFKKFIQNNDYYLYEQPCFVIEGVSQNYRPSVADGEDFISKFLKIGLEKVILFNMAAHPQYSGKKLSLYSHNPFIQEQLALHRDNLLSLENEFLALKDLAYTLGCSIDNPSLFYINHIFCDNLGRQISLTSNENSYFPVISYNNQREHQNSIESIF